MTPRFDFVFSWWLFAWWVLYYFGVVPFNPKLFLILGIIENAFGIFILPPEKIPLYMFINTFIKVLPLVLVWNTVTRTQDVVFGLFLTLVYITRLAINKEQLSKQRTPLTDFLRGHQDVAFSA